MRDYNPIKNIANLCLGQLLQQCLSIYVKLYGHQNFMHTFNAQQTGQIIATWCLQSQPLRARGELTRVQFLKANPPNWSSWAKHTSGDKHAFLNSKTNLSWRFFARPAPHELLSIVFSCFFSTRVSRTPFCKMQDIFWVHGLPLAHLKLRSGQRFFSAKRGLR